MDYIPPNQRIVAIVEAQVCAPADLNCKLDWAKDVLDGVRMTFESLRSSGSRDVVVRPGSARLTLTALAPTVTTGPAPEPS